MSLAGWRVPSKLCHCPDSAIMQLSICICDDEGEPLTFRYTVVLVPSVLSRVCLGHHGLLCPRTDNAVAIMVERNGSLLAPRSFLGSIFCHLLWALVIRARFPDSLLGLPARTGAPSILSAWNGYHVRGFLLLGYAPSPPCGWSR